MSTKIPLEDLIPLEAFVALHVKGEWKPREEYIVQRTTNSRFRITCETAGGFEGLWRQDALDERGIDPGCLDGKEFAQRLLDTLFYHCSPHDIMHVANALEKYLTDWEAERAPHLVAMHSIKIEDATPEKLREERCKD